MSNENVVYHYYIQEYGHPLDSVKDCLSMLQREEGLIPLTYIEKYRADLYTTERVINNSEIELFLDQLDDSLYQLVGEETDKFNNISADARKELVDVVNAWAKKHVGTTLYFSYPSPPELIQITMGMIKAFREGTLK